MIRDLFPSYIDGLTSEVTNGLMEEHLQECESCRAVLASMRGAENAPENRVQQNPEEQKELDFLKKNRRKNRRIVLFSILGAIAAALLLLMVRVFMIGNKNDTSWAAMNLEVRGKELSFSAVPVDSASAIAALSYSENQGVVTVKARSVLVSPLFRGSRQGAYTAEEEIREVRIGDRIVWSEGASVSRQASALFATRHDYIGDMPANNRTATALNIGSYLGPFTNELETAEEPYGWKLLLEEDIPAERIQQCERDMRAFASVCLGLIGNLDHVTYEYRAEGKETTLTVTAEEASALFGEDIKTCGISIHKLDRLMEMTGLSLYPAPEAAESEEQENSVRIVNLTEKPLSEIGFAYYKDGELCSSGSMIHADETSIQVGEIIDCGVEEMNFGGIPDDSAVLEVEISLTTEDGQTVKVPDRIRVLTGAGIVQQFFLRGNEQDGYWIDQ